MSCSSMKRGWKREPGAGEWLCGLIWRLSIMAEQDARRMASQPEAAVHALRVRMKKLRALLRLGQMEGVDVSGIDRHCRLIMRGVSGARDDDVTRRLHWKLFGEAPPWEGGGRGKGWPLAKVRREVSQLTRLAAGAAFAGLDWDQARDNQARCVKQVRKSLERCEQADGEDRFHTLRKRVKRMHFQMLAMPAGPGFKRRARLAKALGKRLGREHDLAVLAQKLAAHGADPGRLAEVERRRRRMHSALLKEGAAMIRS